MLKKRKQLHQYQVQRVLKEYETVLLYQHSGLTPERWREFKVALRQLALTSVSPLDLSLVDDRQVTSIFVKDSIASQVCPHQSCSSGDDAIGRQPKRDNARGTGTIYQGPILLVACGNHNHMVLAHNTLMKQADLHRYGIVLVGGMYHRTELSHKDTHRLLNLDQSAYPSLLNGINTPLNVLGGRLTTPYYCLLGLMALMGKSSPSDKPQQPSIVSN